MARRLQGIGLPMNRPDPVLLSIHHPVSRPGGDRFPADHPQALAVGHHTTDSRAFAFYRATEQKPASDQGFARFLPLQRPSKYQVKVGEEHPAGDLRSTAAGFCVSPSEESGNPDASGGLQSVSSSQAAPPPRTAGRGKAADGHGDRREDRRRGERKRRPPPPPLSEPRASQHELRSISSSRGPPPCL